MAMAAAGAVAGACAAMEFGACADTAALGELAQSLTSKTAHRADEFTASIAATVAEDPRACHGVP